MISAVISIYQSIGLAVGRSIGVLGAADARSCRGRGARGSSELVGVDCGPGEAPGPTKIVLSNNARSLDSARGLARDDTNEKVWIPNRIGHRMDEPRARAPAAAPSWGTWIAVPARAPGPTKIVLILFLDERKFP